MPEMDLKSLGEDVDAVLTFLNIDQLVEAYSAQRAAFPREVSLMEVGIMASLAFGCAVLLLLGIGKRNGTALVGGSLLGVTALVEAFAFGKLGLANPAIGLILQGVYIAIGLAFLTATVRVAKDNMLLGSILLLAIIAAIGFAAVGAANIFDSEPVLKLGLLGMAGFAVLLTLYQGAARGDRLALGVAPGIIMAGASLIVAPMVAKMVAPSWIMVALPHFLLSGGVMLAVLAGTIGNSFAAVAVASGAAAAGAGILTDKPMTHPAKASPEPMVDDETSAVPKKKFFGGNRKGQREEPILDAPDFVTDLNAEDDEDMGLIAPAMRDGPAPDRQMSPEPIAVEPKTRNRAPRKTMPEGRSPTSSLWGRRRSDLPTATAVAATPSGDWQWTPEGATASSMMSTAFGLSGAEMEPAQMRDLVAEHSLETFDEAILGGEQPRSGPFSITLDLVNNERVELNGFRDVDEDGLVAALTADISGAPIAAAQAAPASKPAALSRVNAEEVSAALARGDFKAYFQPIVRLADEQTVGFEALVRWHRGDRILEAEEFVEDVVNAGFGLEMTEVVLREAAQELADWCENAPDQKPFVTVNVSQRDLLNDNLVKAISRTIKEHRLPAGALVVEMTERHLADNPGKLLSVVKALRQAGCSLALDDFGAGYSNLSTLSKFKFDILKTDKSLLGGGKQAETVLSSAVDMASKLGMAVIAEGIETQQLATAAKKAQCGLGQGFYFGHPEPAGGGDVEAMDNVPQPQAAFETRSTRKEPSFGSGNGTRASGGGAAHRPQSVVPNLR